MASCRKFSELPEERLRRQLARYDRKLLNGASSRRRDGDLSAQHDGYAGYLQAFRPIDVAVRLLLSEHGVPLLWFGLYLSFTRHVHRLKRTLCSQAVSFEAREAISSWVAKGLKQSILEEICQRVLEIVPADEQKEGKDQS